MKIIILSLLLISSTFAQPSRRQRDYIRVHSAAANIVDIDRSSIEYRGFRRVHFWTRINRYGHVNWASAEVDCPTGMMRVWNAGFASPWDFDFIAPWQIMRVVCK